jgi:hypothetical protein
MNTPETTQVQRKTNLPHAQFVVEHLAQSSPVILTDAISHWKALTQWTPKFFLERYGSATVMIDGSPTEWQISSDLVLHSEQDAPPHTCIIILSKNTSLSCWRISCRCPVHAANWFESRLFPSKAIMYLP